MSGNERDDRGRLDPATEKRDAAPGPPARGSDRTVPDRTVPDRTVPDRTVPEPSEPERPAPDRTRHPAPGIEHEPEPDADNLIPAKDRPGTL
jgi:hypothetical protein